MEYEIGDDPQGVPDRPDGDRDGGLREGRLLFRRNLRPKPPHGDDYGDEDMPPRQFGELV